MPEKLILTRFHSDKISTCGTLKHPKLKEPIFTLELPWKENKRNVSCIPEGEYKIRPFHSDTHGYCFEIYNVVNRDLIRMHSANSVRENYQDPYIKTKVWRCQLRGCVAPGMKLRLDGIIEHSGDAMNILRKIIRDEMDFEIVNSFCS